MYLIKEAIAWVKSGPDFHEVVQIVPEIVIALFSANNKPINLTVIKFGNRTNQNCDSVYVCTW
nr:hypothetical protein [Mucilaginibacter sp. E4BP6]